MRTGRDDLMTRWLDAERDGADDAAEAALLEMFESLPPLAPPAGFADRVLRRVAIEMAAPVPSRQPVRPWVFRVAVASGVLAMALSLFLLPDLLLVLGRILNLGDVLGFGIASVVDLSRWMSLLVRVGDWLLTVGDALAVSLSSPLAVKVTAACLAVSGVSFAVLRELMTRNRSWSYVDPMR
jgi:hypothetical protein